MKAKIRAIKYISVIMMTLSVIGYGLIDRVAEENKSDIKTLNLSIAHLNDNPEQLKTKDFNEVFNEVTLATFNKNVNQVDFTSLDKNGQIKISYNLALMLNEMLSTGMLMNKIKVMLVCIFCLSAGLFFYNIRRSYFINQLDGMEHNIEEMQETLKNKESAFQKAVFKYNHVNKAYKEAKSKQKELQVKIQQADAVQREMKDFVDIQIQTNEQLMIAESKLKNILEKEQQSKALLTETVDKLKDTQGQLVHSEKMASLGQLTAGIAHEINNPINFIYNGIESIKRNIGDLNQLLNKYALLEQGHDPEALKNEILELKEDMEYEDVQEDLADMVSDIKEGAIRTIEIVKGLHPIWRTHED
ncbi:MAG: hypothetical protein AAFO69_00700, partial [Bacteroidota bacterium]